MPFAPPGLLLLPNADFSNKAAGSRALAVVPRGPTYFEHYLKLTVNATGVRAATLAEMEVWYENIRFLIDSDVKKEMTGEEAIDIAEFYEPGSVQNGILPIYHTLLHLQREANQDALAWGTQGIQTFNIEVSIAAAGLATETFDDLKLDNVQGEGTPLGRHIVTLPQRYNFGSTGIQEITDLPRNPSWLLESLHISQGNGQINEVEILAENSRILKADVDSINQAYIRTGYVPQTRPVSIAWTGQRNRAADFLPLTMNDLRLRLTWDATAGAPGNFKVLMNVIQGTRVTKSEG